MSILEFSVQSVVISRKACQEADFGKSKYIAGSLWFVLQKESLRHGVSNILRSKSFVKEHVPDSCCVIARTHITIRVDRVARK